MEPPYTAVIFTSTRTATDPDGYAQAAGRMARLAAEQPGYLGVDSARGDDGVGITVSYWRTPEDARAWRRVAEHAEVRRMGRERWYSTYTVRIATVERQYAFHREAGDLFHIALPGDWDDAVAAGVYEVSTRGRTLAEEGFIHCSHAHQLDDVLAAFYGDVPEVVVLTVDAALLAVPVVVEDLYDAGEAFPHVYGPIPVEAVTAAVPRRLGSPPPG